MKSRHNRVALPAASVLFVGCLKIFNPATLNLATRKFGEKYVWELRGGGAGPPLPSTEVELPLLIPVCLKNQVFECEKGVRGR